MVRVDKVYLVIYNHGIVDNVSHSVPVLVSGYCVGEWLLCW